MPLEPGEPFAIGDVDVTPVAGAARPMSRSLRIASARSPTSPTRSRFPPTRSRMLRGARVLVINALFRTPHPTHLSIPGGDRGGARDRRRADVPHAPHARQLPRRPRGRAAARHRAGVRRPHRSRLTDHDASALDYTNMMGDADRRRRSPTPTGSDAATRFAEAHAGVADELRGAGTLGFLDLPDDGALHQQTLDFARARAQRRRIDDVVVLGIGGSALGPDRAAHGAASAAVEPARRRERAAASRGCTCSTTSIRTRSPRCSTGSTSSAALFVVISKSGGTAETMAQYLVVRERLDAGARRDGAREHLVFVTDPKKGALRAIAQRGGHRRARHPAERRRPVQRAHAGRHPARRADRHRHGAAARRRGATCATRCARDELGEESRRHVRARCSSSPTRSTGGTSTCSCRTPIALRDIADWFVQLWAESLGKHRKAGRRRRRPDAARRARRDRPAQQGAAVHGRAGRQDGHVHRASSEGGADVEIPQAARRRAGARLPRRTSARRAARHRAARDRGRAGAARAAEHDDSRRSRSTRGTSARCSCSSRSRRLRRRAVRRERRSTSRAWSSASSSPTRCSAAPDAEQARQEWNLLPKPDPTRIV